MKLFDLESPIMRFLTRVADIMILDILVIICCIPIITIGPAVTALHYMCLKMIRGEDCYIIRGFFKSFKENFKQATIIWLILLAAALIFAGDIYILTETGIKFHTVFRVIILIAGAVVAFTATFVFPLLAKFDNTTGRTLKNAFTISVLQLPKTIIMIILNVLPFALLIYFPQTTPYVLFFGFSLPAYIGALMYNKFFQKMEDRVLEEMGPQETEEEGEDERIFKDELDETLIADKMNREAQ